VQREELNESTDDRMYWCTRCGTKEPAYSLP
jgi:hypothetical protein